MVFMDEARATVRGANALADARKAMRTTARNCMILSKDIYYWDTASNQVLEYVKRICDAAFIEPNFKVLRANVDNAIAANDSNNNRIIFYSEVFFNSLSNESYKIAILAHEIGHFVLHPYIGKGVIHRDRPIQSTVIGRTYRDATEVEADYFAACFLMSRKLLQTAFLARFGTKLPLTRLSP